MISAFSLLYASISLSIRDEPVSIVGIVVVQNATTRYVTHIVSVGSVGSAQEPVAGCMITTADP